MSVCMLITDVRYMTVVRMLTCVAVSHWAIAIACDRPARAYGAAMALAKPGPPGAHVTRSGVLPDPGRATQRIAMVRLGQNRPRSMRPVMAAAAHALRAVLVRASQVACRKCDTSVLVLLSSFSGLAPHRLPHAAGCGPAPTGRMPTAPTEMHRGHTRAGCAHTATGGRHGATAIPTRPMAMATPIQPGRAPRSALCGPPFRVPTPIRLG